MKIALIQLGRIGDMILLTPLFKALKERYPESEITVFAGPSNYSIIENNIYVNSIFKIEKKPIGILKTLFYLLKNKYDLWIDPKDHFSNESRIIAKIVRANTKIGFNEKNKKKAFDISIEQKDNLHHSQIAFNSVREIGIVFPTTPPKPILNTNPNSDDYVNKFLRSNHLDDFVLFNISGSKELKMWHNDSWIEFFYQINLNKNIVLCYAPSEEEKAKYIKQQLKDFFVFKSRNISDIVSLVKKCDYLISPDTAIIHIAAAFNKPVFALYSGLDNFYQKFHPLSDIFLTIRAENEDAGIKSIKTKDCVEKFFEFHKLISLK